MRRCDWKELFEYAFSDTFLATGPSGSLPAERACLKELGKCFFQTAFDHRRRKPPGRKTAHRKAFSQYRTKSVLNKILE
jgi:hypothetical protein